MNGRDNKQDRLKKFQNGTEKYKSKTKKRRLYTENYKTLVMTNKHKSKRNKNKPNVRNESSTIYISSIHNQNTASFCEQ